MRELWTGLACAFLSSAVSAQELDLDPDTDGDGLTDFQETHKYFTDPKLADSDGDGTPDGDWNERREWTYTIRTIAQVLPPVTADVTNDDYQDARILEETERYIELEVIHYPLNTVAQGIEADPDWRQHLGAVEHWLEPGPTSNWDAELADALFEALAAEGIDPAELDDRTLVERASEWLCQHAQSHDGFSTYLTSFDEQGKPFVEPGLTAAVKRGESEENLTLEEQWQRELFAKGMFENARRGSCTSSAIYLSGCLRALGVPTRTILTTPLVDASDEREMQSLERLRHPEIRAQLKKALARLEHSWASHTFNEVWVGGRWRRLNYDRLGQNTLDPGLFGLLTHVATFHDWSDANMPATWGKRSAEAKHGRCLWRHESVPHGRAVGSVRCPLGPGAGDAATCPRTPAADDRPSLLVSLARAPRSGRHASQRCGSGGTRARSRRRVLCGPRHGAVHGLLRRR